MKLTSLLFALILSTIFYVTDARTFYVDAEYGNNANNGTTSSSAWKTIAKVNSFTLLPGDIVLFKRGSIWRETLNVNQSGNSTAYIRYGAYGSGNLPVIDCNNSLVNAIKVYQKKFVIIENIKMQNSPAVSASGLIRIQYSDRIIVRNSEFNVKGRAGVFIETSTNSLIQGNKIYTPVASIAFETDGIYAQRNSNNIYDKNHIVISNSNPTPHCDAIQIYSETNSTVSNNYVEHNNTKGANSQGIYITTGSGTHYIFNNVAYGMYTTSSMIKYKNHGTTTGKAVVIGNTIYGGKSALFQTDDPNIIFRNNIIYTTASSTVASFDKAVPSANVSNNVYKRSGTGTLFYMAGSSYTLSTWKSRGFDKDSYEADPLFTNPSTRDFSVKTGSVVVDKGMNLSSPYNVDYKGTARPSGARFDIGAYEKIASTPLSTNETTVLKPNTENNNVPNEFALNQNYPNPFNPSTTINFTLPKNAVVMLKVYDVLGAEVATLLNSELAAGSHSVNFNGSNLASGAYIYRLETEGFVQTRKMMLTK